MFIVRKPGRPRRSSSPHDSEAVEGARVSPLPKTDREPPDVISLDHISQIKSARTDSEIFPTAPALPKPGYLKSVFESILRRGFITSLVNPKSLLVFLGEDQLLRMEDVSRVLAEYNSNYGRRTDLAGTFLQNSSGADLALYVAFVGHEKVTEARVCYNFSGDLELRLNARIHQGFSESFHTSWFNQALKPTQEVSIVKIARSVETDYYYSTLAVPLAFCRYVRLAGNGREGIDFLKIHEFLSSHASELISVYKGGSCYSLSEILRDRIRAETGLNAFVVTRFEDNSVINWPGFGGPSTEGNEHVYTLLGESTHTDVVVPHLKEGRKCYLHIAVGMGSDFSTDELCHINHWGENPDRADIEAFYLARNQVIANPERLAAQGVRCKPNIFMKNTSTGAIFGLDLIKGHLYFNSTAQTTLTEKLEQDEAYARTADYKDSELFIKGLSYAREIFGLDIEFAKDILFLMQNRQQFLKEIIVPPAFNFSACQSLISRTMDLEKERSELRARASENGADLTLVPNESRSLILQARVAVREGAAEDAQLLYTSAITSLELEISALSEVAREMTR